MGHYRTSLESAAQICHALKALKKALSNPETMTLENSLKGTRIAVIGFNARPIACSALRAGASVYVSDYWGDDDLADCSTEFVSVLTPEPGLRQRADLDRPAHVSLVENFLSQYLEVDFDHVIVGSGFDDRSDVLAPIEEQWGICGNSPEIMRRARNVKRVSELAEELKIRYPARRLVNSPESAVKAAEKIGFPCVVRPIRSGGGSDIALVSSVDQTKHRYSRIAETRMSSSLVVQEYVHGIDVSCSVLSSGEKARFVSVQGQLIGLPSAGRNCDFVYCGNYFPHNLSARLEKKVRDFSEAISCELGLIGSNGLDFVVDKKEELWLLEINPRIQGSLEMIERSMNVSLTKLHIDSTNGLLPKSLPSPKPAVKLVVFSRRAGKVAGLSRYRTTVDRTPDGTIVEKGDPVCTILEDNQSLKECYARAITTAVEIQRSLS
ncbi:MAG: ATP-grasp domain-containing protein [Candidatus Thorarchaeota archaeon]|nr:MAG: ATP-grasp domain-containing protein [Candidatus Thorarchaeota archaeon]